MCALRDSNPRRSLRRQLLYPVKLRAHNFMIINKKLLRRQWLFYILVIKTFAIVGNKDKVEPFNSLEHLCLVEKQFRKLKKSQKIHVDLSMI